MQGTILRGIGGFYTVMDDEGALHTLRAQRKLRRDRMKPKVGDRVDMIPGTGEEDGWIQAILPRRNELERPPVANIDKIVLVAAAAAPEADLPLMDRMLLAARRHDIEPVLVVSKCELNPEGAQEILNQYRGADVSGIAVSAHTGENVAALRELLRGSVHALAGQSGAGKSSLINALYGMELETGSLSEKIERGKNTTRRSELIPLSGGGMVLDTPGFSLLDADLFDPVELQESYPEFEPYGGTCFFQPCYHATEPKCGVLDAVRAGEIDEKRHGRYVELLNEMKIRWRERYD
ncbi:MAG: ribosome small subunit-dependent GTPase A [Clostridia bacterium]|nr:ribosome small subunit-dependent GTPase A [Clostridia bacterium]